MSGFTLGMPTLIELADLGANVALASRLGLSFVELNMNEPKYSPRTISAERLRQVRERTGVNFTLHLPEELDLASFHPSIRRGHVDYCLEAIAWAAEAGLRLVNLHLNPGIYFTLPARKVWIYDEYRERFLAVLEESFRVMLERARPANVTICIENGGAVFVAAPFIREAVERLLGLDPHRIGLTWDLGHDAESGFKARPFFEEHPERITHMHLHDFDGKGSHRVLFTGSVDVAAALSLAKRNGIVVVIETKTADALEESVKRIDQHGLR